MLGMLSEREDSMLPPCKKQWNYLREKWELTLEQKEETFLRAALVSQWFILVSFWKTQNKVCCTRKVIYIYIYIYVICILKNLVLVSLLCLNKVVTCIKTCWINLFNLCTHCRKLEAVAEDQEDLCHCSTAKQNIIFFLNISDGYINPPFSFVFFFFEKFNLERISKSRSQKAANFFWSPSWLNHQHLC